jgi:hypothetical protein
LFVDLLLLAAGLFDDSKRSEPPILQAERALVDEIQTGHPADTSVPLRWATALLRFPETGAVDDTLSAFDDQHPRHEAIASWFQVKGTRYGVSYVIHLLLARQEFDRQAASSTAAREFAERMLRRVELTRTHSLRFCDTTVHANLVEMEMLRIVRALLRAADDFQDLRYFNAALKALDQVHRRLIRHGLVKNRDSKSLPLLLTHLHYLDALTHQQRLWREMVEQ